MLSRGRSICREVEASADSVSVVFLLLEAGQAVRDVATRMSHWAGGSGVNQRGGRQTGCLE